MKKYLLLFAISTIGINQYGFKSFFAEEEDRISLAMRLGVPNEYCEKCAQGMFWNDFMQWCQPIPGWVPKKDSQPYKRDNGHNRLPYGTQDINRSYYDVITPNFGVNSTPIEEEEEEEEPE